MDFEAAMRFAGLAETTIRVRVDVCNRCAADIGRPLPEASTDDLVGWVGAHRNAQTRISYMQHLSAFYRFTGLPDPLEGVRRPRQPQHAPRPLTTEQVAAAIAAARTPTQRVWVELEAYGGLRSVEVAATGPQHLAGTRLYLPYTKGGADGWAVIPGWVAADLAAVKPWQVKAWQVQQAVKRTLSAAGVEGTPHQLRHFCGTMVLRATGNLRVTQEVLRHRSPASTAIYTLVADADRAAAVEALPR